MYFRLVVGFLWVLVGSVYAGEETAERLKTIRVMSYNIHHGEGVDGRLDLERIAETILDAKPDVVSLQEVDRGTVRTGGVDQAEELSMLTGMAVVFGASMDFQGGQYGNAVLTRWAYEGARVVPLPGEPRSGLCLTLKWPGAVPTADAFIFIATHLDTSAEPRRASVPLLETVFEEDPTRPAILAGDLNALPDSPTMQALARTWENATAGEGLYTVPVERPLRQIDYILCRPRQSWRVLDAEVLDEAVASDHRAVLTTLEYLGREP